MAHTRLPDRYASPRLVGRGGMGEIYVAEDTVLGREVAIKLLDERFGRDDRFGALQARGADGREALRAPNIVTIFDVGEHEGGRSSSWST